MSHPPELLLQLLQRHLTHSHLVNQIHSLIITNGYLAFKPNSKPSSLKWMNTLLYNTLIRSSLSLNNPQKSILLFTNMLAHQALPNSHTFPSLIKASAVFSPSIASSLGRSLHAQLINRGLSVDPFVQSSFVSFYGQFGELSNARKVFEEIPQPCVVCVNSMLDAFGKNGDMGSALVLFRQMPAKDVVSWTSIISGFRNNGCFVEAIRFFGEMMHHEEILGCVVTPNEATLVSLLSCCANLEGGGALIQGKQIHCYIIRNDVEVTVFLGTALISMYGRTGCLRNAVEVFDRMIAKEVCTWNAIICSLASNGREKQALDMFQNMKREMMKPNEVTFVVLLTACARGKFVELGLRLFDSMSSEFAIVPKMEHYGCVVDLLGKAGLLEEASRFVDRMPFEPDASVLGALLGACKVHGDVELADSVGKKLLELQPQHCGRYIVLSNIYAEAGNWGSAAELRKVMLENGIDKIPAYSCIGSM